MSKKDYNAIAEIIKNSMTDGSNVFFWALFADLTEYFKKDNPRFDSERFFKACYREFLHQGDFIESKDGKKVFVVDNGKVQS